MCILELQCFQLSWPPFRLICDWLHFCFLQSHCTLKLYFWKFYLTFYLRCSEVDLCKCFVQMLNLFFFKKTVLRYRGLAREARPIVQTGASPHPLESQRPSSRCSGCEFPPDVTIWMCWRWTPIAPKHFTCFYQVVQSIHFCKYYLLTWSKSILLLIYCRI